MNRRTLLAALPGAVVATGGCLRATGGGDRPTDGPGDTPSGTPTDAPAETPAGTPTDTPVDTRSSDEGDGAGASFEDVPCPSFADGVDRTVCNHTHSEDAPVYLTASKAVFSPTTGDDTVETTRFVLHNESGAPFGLNPYAWALKRREDEGWSHVAPEMYVEPWVTVPDGGTYDWVLSVEEYPSPDAEETVFLTEDLDSGTYAFQVTGAIEGETDDATGTPTATGGGSPDRRVECIALFRVSRA